MDKDKILKRWQQVGPISEGPVPSYQAKGPEGQFVQVHWVAQDRADLDRLSSLVRVAHSNPPPGLVEVIELEGGQVVVTHILPGQVTLEGWLTEHADHLDRSAPPADQVSEPEDSASGAEYSAYFRIPQEGSDQGQASGSESPESGTAGSGPREGPPIGESYTAFFEAGSPPKETKPPEPREAPQVQNKPPPQKQARPAPGRSGSQNVKAPWDLAKGSSNKAGGSPSSPPDSASITDMFRRPEAPVPPTPSVQRGARWSEPERGLPPLQISLGEYLRRLRR